MEPTRTPTPPKPQQVLGGGGGERRTYDHGLLEHRGGLLELLSVPGRLDKQRPAERGVRDVERSLRPRRGVSALEERHCTVRLDARTARRQVGKRAWI